MTTTTATLRITADKASQALRLARKHVGNGAEMESSARLCLSNAVEQFDLENYRCAWERAVDSLAYSVGVGHKDYQNAHYVNPMVNVVSKGHIRWEGDYEWYQDGNLICRAHYACVIDLVTGNRIGRFEGYA